MTLHLPAKREVVLSGDGASTYPHTLDQVIDQARTSLPKLTVEQVWVACFNMQGVLLGTFLLGEGDQIEVDIDPRKLLQVVLKTNCSMVLILHNHLAPDLAPSDKDLRATEQIEQLLSWVKVELIDNVIVDERGEVGSVLGRVVPLTPSDEIGEDLL